MIKTWYFPKLWAESYHKSSKNISFDFLLTRNRGPKLQNLKNFLNFEPEYLLWASLAHRLLWFFWKSFGSTFIPWKKSLCVTNGLGLSNSLKITFCSKCTFTITHNGVGLRSDIRSGGFLASSNIVL